MPGFGSSPLSWDFQARPELLNQLHLALLSFFGQSQKSSEGLAPITRRPWDRLAQLSALHLPSPRGSVVLGAGFLGEAKALKTAGLSGPLPGPGKAINLSPQTKEDMGAVLCLPEVHFLDDNFLALDGPSLGLTSLRFPFAFQSFELQAAWKCGLALACPSNTALSSSVLHSYCIGTALRQGPAPAPSLSHWQDL